MFPDLTTNVVLVAYYWLLEASCLRNGLCCTTKCGNSASCTVSLLNSINIHLSNQYDVAVLLQCCTVLHHMQRIMVVDTVFGTSDQCPAVRQEWPVGKA